METLGTDELIVERALTGDAEAFGEIVRRWERRIFALAYGMLGPRRHPGNVSRRFSQLARLSRRGKGFVVAAPDCGQPVHLEAEAHEGEK